MKYIVTISPSLNEEAHGAFRSKHPGVPPKGTEFSIKDFRESPAEGELVSYLMEDHPIWMRGTIHRVSREYQAQAYEARTCRFICELEVDSIYDEESCVWKRA